MTPEQWRKVGELFHAALEVSAADRAAWVENASAGDSEVHVELLSLLESDRAAAAGAVESRVLSAVVSLFDGPAAPPRVGPYKLVRELGRGGMGTVYLAERDDEQYQTRVAI